MQATSPKSNREIIDDDLIDEQEHNLSYHQYDYEGKIPDIRQDYYAEHEDIDGGEPEDEAAGNEAEP